VRTWTVPGVVLAVHDGDTCKLDYDLGWHVWVRGAMLRLAGCDPPVLATPAGIAARDFVAALLPIGTAVQVVSHGFDKWGRTLGALQLPDGRDLAELLIQAGHAVPYHGGPR